MDEGDSIYFDIRMRHGLSSPKGKEAKVLVITTSEDQKFMEMERALASHGLTNIAEWDEMKRERSEILSS